MGGGLTNGMVFNQRLAQQFNGEWHSCHPKPRYQGEQQNLDLSQGSED